METQKSEATPNKPNSTLKKQKSGIKRLIIIGAAAAVVVVAGIVFVPRLIAGSQSAQTADAEKPSRGNAMQSMVSASGTTAAGSLSQSLETSLPLTNTVYLEIEKLYVSSGDELSVGDSILKVTDASYATVLAYLEDALSDATRAEAEAEIQYKSDLLDAKLDKNTNEYTKTTAKKEYDQTISELNEAVSAAKKQRDAAQTAINNDPALITKKTAELKTAQSSEKTQTSAIETHKKEVEAAESTAEKASAALTEATLAYQQNLFAIESIERYMEENGLSEDESFKQYVAQLSAQTDELKAAEEAAKADAKAAEEALAAAEKALSEAEAALAEAQKSISSLATEIAALETELSQAKSNIAKLKITYNQAVTAKETQSIAAKATYEEALVSYNNADALYEIAIGDLEDTLNEAKDALTSAQNNLDSFKAEFANGELKSDYAGKMTSLTAREGGVLTSMLPVAAFSDPSTITVTVAVDQADINGVSVGDTATINISGSEMLAGTVVSKETSSSSASVSNVTYNVTISVPNDDGSLSSGLSATVLFGGATMQGGGRGGGTGVKQSSEPQTSPAKTTDNNASSDKIDNSDNAQATEGTENGDQN